MDKETQETADAITSLNTSLNAFKEKEGEENEYMELLPGHLDSDTIKCPRCIAEEKYEIIQLFVGCYVGFNQEDSIIINKYKFTNETDTEVLEKTNIPQIDDI